MTKVATVSRLEEAVRGFDIPGELRGVTPVRVGHIHDSFSSEWQDGQQIRRYFHQRLNSYVFPDLEALTSNLLEITSHLRKKIRSSTNAQRQEVLEPILTPCGRPLFRDADGKSWRTLRFIENSRNFSVCHSPELAYESALRFGQFARWLMDLEPGKLHPTIPRFFDTPSRFETLWKAVQDDPVGRVSSAQPELAFAAEWEDEGGILVKGLRSGELPTRIVHYDPKLNNLLFDQSGTRGICVVDLDTTMAGTILYDIGDLVRNAGFNVPEDETDLEQVALRLPFFEAILAGYAETNQDTLSEAEILLVPVAPRIIALMLGVRFLTDYLLGDRYFRVSHASHNLQRSRTQFRIFKDLQERHQQLEKLSRRYLGSP